MDQGLKQLINFDIKEALKSANEKIVSLEDRHANDESQQGLSAEKIYADAELLRWIFKALINHLSCDANQVTIPKVANRISTLI